ncbi:MAG TPA: hypothetical protein DCW29_17625 [Janthinobacterium sp.]|nr:hypothetical protein [Janthinobacterium sp.]
MNKGIIRLGDPHSHGGKVIQADARATVNGVNVARQGDACSCPIPGHHNCKIAEGHPTHSIDGIPVAYAGHKTTCGGTLESTAPSSGWR